mmetsp:Transcript_3316/g.2768  ORF Transcript_3316/g.2768 Transcript_3316/m.2768 type:complete len:194 (+) Transcript_3316:3-584(+)
MMHNNGREPLIERNQLKFEHMIIGPMRGRIHRERKLRNQRECLITLIFVQIASAIAGFATYMMRRNRVSIIINIFALILAGVGFSGTTSCNWTLTVLHCTLTTGIVGSFFFYEILFAFFGKRRVTDEYQIEETWILLILSVPYLIDLFIGIYSAIFTVRLVDSEDENEIRREQEEMNQELQVFNQNLNENAQC